jgi:hypothetical protein
MCVAINAKCDAPPPRSTHTLVCVIRPSVEWKLRFEADSLPPSQGGKAMQLEELSPICRPTQCAGLQGWRQQRVTEYIELHMRDTIRLPHLAAAAGLTRMHFAAQFRIATGIRPHHYIQLRRIEKAF